MRQEYDQKQQHHHGYQNALRPPGKHLGQPVSQLLKLGGLFPCQIGYGSLPARRRRRSAASRSLYINPQLMVVRAIHDQATLAVK